MSTTTGMTATPVNTAASERRKARREQWRLIVRRPAFIFGMLILMFWLACALFPTLIASHDPLDFRAMKSASAGQHLSPRALYPFGTDASGRDVFSRVIAGARDVFKIAPVGALLGVLLGVILGMLMGYLGSWFDLAASRVVEAFIALPVVLVALLAITTLGRSSWVVIGVIAVLFTPIVARTVRAAVLAERDLDYVTSAKLRGESKLFIMFREILPNITSPLLVITSRQDHVVPPENSDILASSVSGPVERLWCERSYHVVTQDYDRELVFDAAVDFAQKVTASA